MSLVGSRLFHISTAVALSAASAFAQNVISAKSGLIHYTEGDVSVDGKAVSDKFGTFTHVEKGAELATDMGRAEVLLTPGVFLRVGEHSAVKMIENQVTRAKIELVSGQSMIESDTPMKDNVVTMVYKDYSVTFLKHGLYGFQSDPAQLKVYSGEAEVAMNGGASVVVREGRLLPFSAALATEKFDSKEGDALYRWAKRRSEYISVANVSAAKSASNSPNGYSNSMFSNYGSWAYNPYYSMYTYLPFQGTSYSPFGFAYFSPFTVGSFLAPYYYGGGGYSGSGGGTTIKPATHTSVLSSNSAVLPLSRATPTLSSGSGTGSGSVARTGHR